ncbi:MAG TPA: hypothetical protein VF713_15145 [Thermoanaerobaculia bacterium]
MTRENRTGQPSGVWSGVLKALTAVGVLGIVSLGAGHLAWKYSGSNQWQPVIEKDGIKIYSRKTPGFVLKDWKGIRRVRTTLNGAVAAMTSTKTEDCAEWYRNCVSVQSVQPWNSLQLSYIHLFRTEYPAPFGAREILVEARASQEAQSKAVVVQFVARPNDLPPNECCVRITEYHNTWRFGPRDGGDREVELVVHMDQKLPYFLVNRVAPGALYKVFSRLPELFNEEKWQHAKFDSIEEQ